MQTSTPTPIAAPVAGPATTGPTPPQADARRRLALGTIGSLGIANLLGCGGGSDTVADSSGADTGTGTGSGTGTGTGTGTSTTCSVVPEETAGPYPADGSNASNANYNVLALSGIVRQDIRSSIGASTAVGGVPLTIAITLTNTRSSCAPLQGYAIYLWHCSQGGDYSVYTERSIAANYLRGVQATDASGTVTFTTIVPGCYAGRMPHMHLEVYPSLAVATTAGNKVKTTQLAFPTDTLRTIYAANAGYSASVPNLAAITFATDNVFSDGTDLEMTTLQSNGSGGYTASITISIAA
ncbi:intradiol ring-cleavage dioxygenase [Paracidovorax valerianellae]|uniref:Dioxygenase n=1 Tax=Paracidovorax valerianellae TaxID=187868 RepID=A0A1G6L1S4_9BURK|nr:intradiol ring-cleavage dioxygenase [Paracidovorax valerianellae]MDA8446525.1 intradiol ring-cleavage dioxygenase [Paracidovorax valerianellae]SDC36685.1 Dioxygenase [Paracidovorax valerianellae]